MTPENHARRVWGYLGIYRVSGYHIGAPILRIIVYWGLHWGLHNLGKLPYIVKVIPFLDAVIVSL